MDRSRLAVLVAAAAVSLAAAVFAIGAAVASDDERITAPSPAPSSTAGAASDATATTTGAGSDQPAAERVDVAISGSAFGPEEVVIQVGTEVVWTNDDSIDHSVIADGQTFASSPTLGEGDTYSVVFTEPGTYEYLCGFHPRMRGTIVVEG